VKRVVANYGAREKNALISGESKGSVGRKDEGACDVKFVSKRGCGKREGRMPHVWQGDLTKISAQVQQKKRSLLGKGKAGGKNKGREKDKKKMDKMRRERAGKRRAAMYTLRKRNSSVKRKWRQEKGKVQAKQSQRRCVRMTMRGMATDAGFEECI